MFHFLDTGGHFFFGTAVHYNSPLRSQTLGRTHGVHGGITTAYHGNALAHSHRRIGFGIGGIHQIDPGKVFVGRENMNKVLAGNIHKIGQTRSASYENAAITLFFEFVYGDSPAYDAVGHELHAHLTQIIDFHIHHGIGQTKFGNTVFEHPAYFVQGFEHHHFITVFGHVAGKRKSGRSRTHHSHFFTVFGRQFRHRNTATLAFVIGGKTLQMTYSHRGLTQLERVNAPGFALFFLGADPPANCRQRTGFFQHPCRFEKIAAFDVFYKAWNLNFHRTTQNTGGIGAIQTAGSLLSGLFGC